MDRLCCAVAVLLASGEAIEQGVYLISVIHMIKTVS